MMRNAKFVVNKLRLNRINTNRIIQRLEHSHSQPPSKTEDIQKIIKELEAINKNVLLINEDVKQINLISTAILSMGTGSIIGAIIGKALSG
jgi:hypothetical protein